MQALLGVLEEQAVSVAKAGMCATFPARTGVVAAANPHKGHWQRSRTLRENLKLPQVLKTMCMRCFARSQRSPPTRGDGGAAGRRQVLLLISSCPYAAHGLNDVLCQGLA